MDQVNEDKNIGDESGDRKTGQCLTSDLDTAVAHRVMGLVPCDKWQSVNFGRAGGAAVMNTGCEHASNCYPETAGPPPFSTEIAAATRVEDRIAELGLQNDYIAHLWDEVGAARDGSLFWTAQNFNAFWLCVHATPEQRCRAALKAVEHLSTNDGQES